MDVRSLRARFLTAKQPPRPAAPLYATPPGGRRLFLYKSRRILQAGMVRLSLLVLAFLALATPSYAQEQERKLVDRLLSPNTKLQIPTKTKSSQVDRRPQPDLPRPSPFTFRKETSAKLSWPIGA